MTEPTRGVPSPRPGNAKPRWGVVILSGDSRQDCASVGIHEELGTSRMALASLARSQAKAARRKGRAAPRRRAPPPPREVQPKLKIGNSTDACEREADEMAGFVLSGRHTGARAERTSEVPPGQAPAPVNTSRAPAPREADASAQEDQAPPGPAAHSASEHGQHETTSTQAGYPSESFETEFEVLRRTGGQPLPRAIRDLFEPRFGADFSNVRAYTGPRAHRLAESIGARAFTYGTDIVFADGEFSTSPRGVSLLAHELTHILQQRPSDQPGSTEVTHDTLIVRRACACGPQERTTKFADFPICCGVRDTGTRKIRFDALKMPKYKSSSAADLGAHFQECAEQYKRLERAHHPLIRSANYTRTDDSHEDFSPEQQTVWKTLKDRPGASRLQRRALDIRAEAYGLRAKERSEELRRGFFFQSPVAQDETFGRPTLAGTMTNLLFPKWSRGATPKAKSFQVDHMLELQLANWIPSHQEAAGLHNLWLLEQSANGSSGSKIANEIERRVKDHVAASVNKDTPDRDAEHFLKLYAMHFKGHTTGLAVIEPKAEDVWQKQEILDGDHLQAVTASDRSRYDHKYFDIRVYRTENTASTPKDFAWNYTPGAAKTLSTEGDEKTWAPVLGNDLRIESMTLTVGADARGKKELGHIEVNIPKDNAHWKRWDENRRITILVTPDALYAGHVKQEGPLSLKIAKERMHKRLSPTEVMSFEVDANGYRLEGRINAEAPLFHDAGAAAGTPLHINFTEEANESSRASSDQLTIPNQRLSTSNLELPEGLEPTRVDMGIREGRGGHIEIYGGVQASIAHLGELEAKASLGARGIELTGKFKGTGVFEGLRIDDAHYTQYKDDTRTSRGGLSIKGSYTFQGGTVPYLESGVLSLDINNDEVSFGGRLRVEETAWLEPGSEVNFRFDKGAIAIDGRATLRESLLPPGITAAGLEFEGAFVDNGLDLQAKATAQFDAAKLGFPIKSLKSGEIVAIWKNGEITIGGTVNFDGDLSNAGLPSGTPTSAPAAKQTRSFLLENASLSLYATSRRLDSSATPSEIVPTLGQPMRRGIAPQGVRSENTRLVWWGSGDAKLKYGNSIGAGLHIEVSPDNVWTLSGTLTFETLTTLMDKQDLLSLPRKDIELAGVGIPPVPIAGPVGVGVSVAATVYYEADIQVGPVTVEKAELTIKGVLGVPDSIQITGQAGLNLNASGDAAVGMKAGAKVSLTLINLDLAGIEGSIEGSLRGRAEKRAGVNVRASWSPQTGLRISDVGPDFGLDVRFGGDLKARIDVTVAWISIWKEEVTLADFDVGSGPGLGDLFGTDERLSRFNQSGPEGPYLGESMDAQTEFSTGLRARFQNKGDMKGRAEKIIQFLGGSDGNLKPELDKRLDPNLVLPDSQARAQRLAAVITSGRAANLARRYGLRAGGTLAVDLFHDMEVEPEAGEARRGLLLGMDQSGNLVVADLAVEVLGMERDWYDFLLRRFMKIRVLDISAFYDGQAQRSAFTGKPAWSVGQVRSVNENPLDDSPHRPFAPADCPNCHDLTQPRFQPQFLFDTPTTPLEESVPGSSAQTCTTCHKPSVPLTVAPSFQSPRFGSGSGYTTDLTAAQRQLLLEYIAASQEPPAKPH